MANKNTDDFLIEEAEALLIGIHNSLVQMRILRQLPPTQMQRIANEAHYFYAPIAHRLGLDIVKAELEDCYLEFYSAPLYHAVKKLVNVTKEGHERFKNHFTHPIEKLLTEAGLNFTVKARIKSISSVINKMEQRNIALTEVYDVFAIRIILDVPPEKEHAACWEVHDILTNHYQTLHKKLRDWLTEPRPSGYQALHVTLVDEVLSWVEVQIRTTRTHEVAEKGSAAHWKYKLNSPDDPLAPIASWLMQIRIYLEQNPNLAKEMLGTNKEYEL